MYHLVFDPGREEVSPALLLIVSFLSFLGLLLTLLAMVIKAYTRLLSSITCALKEQANVHKAYFQFKCGQIKRKKAQKKNRR